MQLRGRYARMLVATAAWIAPVLLLHGAHAHAQTCHTPSLREPVESGLHVGVVQVFATFSDAEAGEYQGLIATLLWDYRWLAAELAVPAYHLVSAGHAQTGLGDIVADVRAALYRTDSGMWATGIELAASLPSGDAARELGMGHVMAMPGAWLRLSHAQFTVLAQLAYGRALASSTHPHGHVHHGGSHAAPRVNPMNISELEHALGLRYAVHPNLSLTARWLGAVPLEAAGFERQVIAPGLQLAAGALDAAIEAQFPIAGDPFDLRLSVAIGMQL